MTKVLQPGDDHDGVVQRINVALNGPVIDALASLMPEVAALPRQDALERILDDVDLLHRCFHVFRTNLDAFRPLLRGLDGALVEDSETPLICGRTLDQIEAMIVRTAAKRHFRRRLDHDTRRLRSDRKRQKPKSGVFERLRQLLSGRPTRVVRPKSRADQLYDALKAHLLYDWQLPLVPEYSAMSPGVANRVADRLLDYKVAEDVHRLRVSPDYPPPPTSIEVMEYLAAGAFALPPTPPPQSEHAKASAAAARPRTGAMAPAPEADQIAPPSQTGAPVDAMLTPDGATLRPDAFAGALTDPKLAALIPGSQQSLRPGAVLASVGADTARKIVAELGLSTENLALFLVSIAALVGDRSFALAFGGKGGAEHVDRLVARAKAAGIGPSSQPQAIVDFLTKAFRK